MTTCPKCRSEIGPDGLWPVTVDGEFVLGCHDCFEAEAAAGWWEVAECVAQESESGQGRHPNN